MPGNPIDNYISQVQSRAGQTLTPEATQQLRSSLEELYGLKGTPDWTGMTRYVFRNALLPQITALALSLGTIFSGALLTEMLFSYPGVGLLMRTAAGAGDYNLLYGTITMAIIAVATAALVLDLLYPLFDPRIRLSCGDDHEATREPQTRQPAERGRAGPAQALGAQPAAVHRPDPDRDLRDRQPAPAAVHESRPGGAGHLPEESADDRQAPARDQRAGSGHLLVPGLRDPQLAAAGRRGESGHHGDLHVSRPQRRLHRRSGANTLDIIFREIFPYVYAYMVVGFINTILFAINTEAALAVIGLSKVQAPTLGSIIFWALNYNAMMIGQTAWIIAPIVATVLLFLTSTGYNEFFAERRGVA